MFMLKKTEVKMGIKYFPFAMDIDCYENFDFVLCYSCSVWWQERRQKTPETMGFPVNAELKCFVNLYGSLQAHSQTGQYGIAHIWNFKVSV